MTVTGRIGVALAGASAFWSWSAGAADRPIDLWGHELYVNGFAAQGFVLSEGNNVFGESTDGTFQYFELGLNGTVNLGRGLTLSAQEVVRRAGATDTGKLRLDYAFADYQFLRDPEFSAGVRAGKVKNYFGLFNDARDVVFTRPGILMPDSIYNDMTGQQRALLFGIEGGQLYGDVAWGAHELSLVATAGLDRELTPDEKRLFIDLGGLPFEVEIRDLRIARFHDSIDGGRWILAASALGGELLVTTAPTAGVSGDLRVELYVGSVRYNAERYSVTVEYAAQATRGNFSLGGAAMNADSDNEGAYVQLDYRFSPEWTAMTRFDAHFSERGDYDGSSCEAETPPRDRHECFSHDAVVGVKWSPVPQFGLWGEWHVIDGVGGRFSGPDNAGRSPDFHWNVFLMMMAFRF